MFTIDRSRSYIIVRSESGRVVFRHDSADDAAALADFRACADALGVKLTKTQPTEVPDAHVRESPFVDEAKAGQTRGARRVAAAAKRK